jgi:hypothetical protein
LLIFPVWVWSRSHISLFLLLLLLLSGLRVWFLYQHFWSGPYCWLHMDAVKVRWRLWLLLFCFYVLGMFDII